MKRKQENETKWPKLSFGHLRSAGGAMGDHPLAGWGNPWRQDPRHRGQIASDNRGIVLLVSLMIMLILTASGIALSTVIINSLRSSRNTNQAAVAYYGAESGIERALFEATTARLVGDALADTASDLEALPNQSLSVPGLSFALTATHQDTTGKVTTSLARNQTTSLDFFNVDNSLSASDVRRVRINWKSTEDAKPEWVEVSWVGWQGDTFANNMSKRYYSSADLPDITFWITSQIQPLATRLRIKALKSDINDLTIETLDSGGTSVLIPESRLFITSVGAYQTSKQALSTDVRWQLPLSPLFDYAIFSEEPIVK